MKKVSGIKNLQPNTQLNSDRGRLFLLKTVCVRGERFKLDMEIFTLGATDHVPRI